MTPKKKTVSPSVNISREKPIRTTELSEIQMVLDARHGNPFAFLGLHSAASIGKVIRAFDPHCEKMSVIIDGVETPMAKINAAGFFEALLPQLKHQADYRLKVTDARGNTHERQDVYQFASGLGEQDLYFFGEGTHRGLWKILGAHPVTMSASCQSSPDGEFQNAAGVPGVRFAVWAPNAWRVSVVGDFNNWDGRVHSMRNNGGVWDIFIPEVPLGAHYKYEIVGREGDVLTKSDPFAFYSQHGIDTASMVYDLNQYKWQDKEWMDKRVKHDLYHQPMSVYEVHLGSWKRKSEEGDRFLTYIEFAGELIDYVVDMGFTHIELMPVTEFPFDGSWGYQVCGYYAPTSRFGSPDEFRSFVDTCHRRGIGVIMDWVPAHFPKDAHGLGRFDGTALYEHEDPRMGEHEDWGTLIFNYGRNEVRNFLVANALYWMKEYHIDGIRVDAVASMLYLDYSREEGQWLPNEFGGRENLGAIEFMKQLNLACYEECPGITTIAEESTAFTGVSRPIDQGGLGFGFKWNMGWMNDSLSYISKEPVHRKYHHGEATFSMVYAYTENYVLVLSHDEVVHGKGSMLNKMPGDRWGKHGNLRMFYAWMFAHPGKKLLFQGLEFGQSAEWDHDKSLDWHLLDYPEHKGLQQAIKDLNHLYMSEPALYQIDHEPGGFEWVLHDDSENSVFAFFRKGRNGESILVLVNATPVLRENYRVGVPGAGFYEEVFNSDAEIYGGGNQGNAGGIPSEAVHSHDRDNSIVVKLPPLSTVYFKLREV